MSQLQFHILRANHTQDINQERRLKADRQRRTLVSASDGLLGAGGEVDVLRGDVQAVLAERQFQERSAGVGKHGYALAGCDKGLLVDDCDIGVVLRNDGIVVGEASLNLAANQGGVAKDEPCVLHAEGNRYVAFHLRQHVLEQSGRFLRQDETDRLCCAHGGVRKAHQAVCIRSHQRSLVGGDIEEDTVHHGTQLVVCGAEEGLVDGI